MGPLGVINFSIFETNIASCCLFHFNTFNTLDIDNSCLKKREEVFELDQKKKKILQIEIILLKKKKKANTI